MKLYGICIALIVLCFPMTVYAEEEGASGGGTFTFYQENDLYTGTDRDYTNGIKLSWISPDLSDFKDDPRLPAWSYPLIDALPFSDGESYFKAISLSLGQSIYTPENIETADPIPDDRPYAGITYFSVGFISSDTRIMSTWEFAFGMIGPHSYAEDGQKVMHEWTDSDSPNGWDNQVKDEPLLNIYYERKWRLARGDDSRGLSYDAIPHAGCAVGNALTGMNIGGQVRYGWNLLNDFGTLPIGPGSDTNVLSDAKKPSFIYDPQRFGIHTFITLDVFATLYNITLDGNFLRKGNGMSVEKNPLTAQAAIGLGATYGRLKFTYAYVAGTREYKTQDERHAYGAITISYTFR